MAKPVKMVNRAMRTSIPEVLTTQELAARCHTTPNALHTSYSKKGHWQGIRPKKVGRRLLWPALDTARLLGSHKSALSDSRTVTKLKARVVQIRELTTTIAQLQTTCKAQAELLLVYDQMLTRPKAKK